MSKATMGTILILLSVAYSITNAVSRALWRQAQGTVLPLWLMSKGFSSSAAIYLTTAISILNLGMLIAGIWLRYGDRKKRDNQDG